MKRNLGRIGGLAALVAFAAGCGGSGGMPCGAVSGKITYKGEPVKGATVYFNPVASGGNVEVGKVGVGATDDSGFYRISTYTVGGNDGAVIGKHHVAIVGGGFKDAFSPKDAPAVGTPIPPKYSNPKASGLEVEVKSGKNTFDFELKDE